VHDVHDMLYSKDLFPGVEFNSMNMVHVSGGGKTG
jgi:hypothetical protein